MTRELEQMTSLFRVVVRGGGDGFKDEYLRDGMISFLKRKLL